MEEKENKLEIDWKKVFLSIAVILIVVSFILFIYLFSRGSSQVNPPVNNIEDRVQRELDLKERMSALRSRQTEKRKLTEEEKGRIENLKQRQKEEKKKVDRLEALKEKTKEQKEIEERLKKLQER